MSILFIVMNINMYNVHIFFGQIYRFSCFHESFSIKYSVVLSKC